MDSFLECVARLKRALGVSKDIEVAELLGFSKAAFSERKRRDAFPDRELRALAAKRPDLRIDVDFVLTGESSKQTAERMLANFGPRLKEIRGDRTPAAFAKLLGITVKDVAALEGGQRRPTTQEVIRLQEAHPDRSVNWLFGGDAPRLDRALDDLEVILVQNYRASAPEAREALRQQAAFYASLSDVTDKGGDGYAS